MNETVGPDPGTLRQSNRAALELSVAAAARHPDTVRRLRSLATAVVCQAVDIGAYHHTAAEIVRLLEILCTTGAGTFFVYFRRGLDPRCEGHVRTFRPLCRDLLTVLEELQRRRPLLRLVE